MPDLYIIGGCNGAGKTTTAMRLLPRVLGIAEYVNADAIASGLSPFNPESVALQAGKLMLQRLQSLAVAGKDFAFETTLASRTFVPFITRCKSQGYRTTLIYFWLQSPELAIERVAKRVQSGGHRIPEEVIRRRYERGRINFKMLYLPLTDRWRVYDNSASSPELVAKSNQGLSPNVYITQTWRNIMQ